jgi:hypothetical protein
MLKKLMVLSLCLGLIGCAMRDGIDGVNGANGAAGLNGSNGADGSNGTDGLTSLTRLIGSAICDGVTILSGLDVNANNVLEGDEVTQSADVCYGGNLDTPFLPVAIVNPCGDAPGIIDEVFLQLSNGTLLASFSANASGLNTRFAVLPAGSYQTTDGDNCKFDVTANGEVVNERH